MNTIASLIAAATFGFVPATMMQTFDQKDFPCQEDEVLGYAPQFGPDKVGCIHIEDLR